MNYSSVNVHSVREKIGSKKELYDFLTQDCNAFLPKLTCTNVYFLKSIINGQKEYLKRGDVIVSAVPQIEGLTAEDFMDFAQTSPRILAYFPDQCDWLHLDKKWVCDMVMSLDKEGALAMINKAKEARRDKFNQKQNLIIQMRPEIAQALNQTLQFSNQKGRSAFLLKDSSNRKRNKKELEEVKQEQNLLSQSKQKYLEQNKRVREEFGDLQQQVEELQDYKQLVMQLHSAGVINEEGNPLPQSFQPHDRME